MDDHHYCFWDEQQQICQPNAEMESSESNLKQALFRATLDLESTRSVAQQLAHLLLIATKERDVARRHCHSLLLLLQQQNPNPNLSPSFEVSPLASSSSPSSSSSEGDSSPPPPPALTTAKELPEKGKLVEAVMRAGPLLQTLMLAGPLPEWRHPPPAIASVDIPTISILRNPGFGFGKRKREEPNFIPNYSPTEESNGNGCRNQTFSSFRA